MHLVVLSFGYVLEKIKELLAEGKDWTYHRYMNLAAHPKIQGKLLQKLSDHCAGSEIINRHLDDWSKMLYFTSVK